MIEWCRWRKPSALSCRDRGRDWQLVDVGLEKQRFGSPALSPFPQTQLKLLKVVVKNLSDPAKSNDPKYRQLKLDNEKVRAKILTCDAAVPLLHAIGFVETTCTQEGARVLRVEGTVNNAAMATLMQELMSCLTSLDQANNQNKKPKLNPANSSSFGSTVSDGMMATSVTKMSEKQKARALKEEKEKKDKEAAKAHRKKNIAMLKQDKHVRQNDENWTSGVSAACSKSGDSISTFRDKFGE